MAYRGGVPPSPEQSPGPRRRLFGELLDNTDMHDEPSATANARQAQQTFRRVLRSNRRQVASQDQTGAAYSSAQTAEQASVSTATATATASDITQPATTSSPARGRGSRRTLRQRGRRRGASSSNGRATGSPPSRQEEAVPGRGNNANENRNLPASLRGGQGTFGQNFTALFEREDSLESDELNYLEDRWAAEGDGGSSNLLPGLDIASTSAGRSRSGFGPHYQTFGPDFNFWDEEDYPELDDQFSRLSWRLATRNTQNTTDDSSVFSHLARLKSQTMKRSRPEKIVEPGDGKDLMKTLAKKGAVAVLQYNSGTSNPAANDVWPDVRNVTKLPAHYCLLDKSAHSTAVKRSRPTTSSRPAKMLRSSAQGTEQGFWAEHDASTAPQVGWPPNEMPTELFEEIVSYLNRDDVKAMRLVCREFDRHVSQVLFRTVVVPFNTEIYGMLGKEKDQNLDLKGKKKGRVDQQNLVWKNANGDDVYNGHGLDVFRGFGKHILRYGMSFEVTEDSLAKPPEKLLTEQHQSFWGSYDWPFEEYRRFEDVAGLESAADETPRMKTAFAELSKVRELALSLDSGLGWLNGPDRSIRASVIRRAPEVFGTLKDIPDRRAQAQNELWDHIESCHRHPDAGDVKFATLYKWETSRPLAEMHEANLIHQDQPEMPFLDPRIINDAVPHDASEMHVPASFDDPEVLEKFIAAPSAPGSGILFTSTVMPTDSAILQSAIIPANLSKAQKEWLLETEWAQRAFLSSYMLSIIDNPSTFGSIHTLNISRMSDRYLPMLNRADFWDSLRGLNSVILHVIPGWRIVAKDEAGFVETPKISPTSGLNIFYDLLANMICGRQNIKKLRIGWARGGEHAEGVHARNKHILPAPILPADGLIEMTTARFSSRLLKFPHVEELTLKNCWVTPPALRELVIQHDDMALRTLVLDSVSLTAMLRHNPNAIPQNQGPQGVGQHALNLLAQAAGLQIGGNNQGVNALGGQAPQQQQQQQQQQNHPQQIHNGGGLLGGNQLNAHQHQVHNINPHQVLAVQTQVLQLQIQHLLTQHTPQAQQQIAQLQTQINQNIQLQNNMWNQAPTAAQPAIAQPNTANAQNVLKAEPREGSWMYILDIISPGLNLFDFESTHSLADPERKTSLRTINFRSCGYVRLPYVGIDQTVIEPTNPLVRNPIFTKRYTALAPAMLNAKWPLLGEIIQEVDIDELGALNAGWFLNSGWKDAEEAAAVEFDGLLPGGTGRFTGLVRKTDRLVAEEAK